MRLAALMLLASTALAATTDDAHIARVPSGTGTQHHKRVYLPGTAGAAIRASKRSIDLDRRSVEERAGTVAPAGVMGQHDDKRAIPPSNGGKPLTREEQQALHGQGQLKRWEVDPTYENVNTRREEPHPDDKYRVDVKSG